VAHGYIAAILVAMIVLHVLAAIYHQFVRKDGLFGRMFFGQCASDSSRPGK
jgi:cytochrome b561